MYINNVLTRYKLPLMGHMV